MGAVAEYLDACDTLFHEHVYAPRVRRYIESARVATGPMPFYRLASLCWDAGAQALWREGVSVAFSWNHDTCQELYHRAGSKIRLGDWSGWTDFEARVFHPGWGCSGPDVIAWTHQAWDGVENLADETLLVRHQVGFGDDLLMLRFIPTIATRVGRIILDVKPALFDLVAHNFGHIATVACVAKDGSDAAFDRYLWNMSLPHIVGHLPAFVPLTAPTPDRSQPTGSRPFRAGVCWASGSGADHYPDRSMPLTALAPLFDLPNVHWQSLQVGERAGDADAFPPIQPADRPLVSFADTADVIATLDCVVTVDTAVCHVAGYLGVPTFLLLRCASDWRWGLADTTSWYPTMTLVRQPTLGDWRSAVEAVHSQLVARVTTQRS